MNSIIIIIVGLCATILGAILFYYIMNKMFDDTPKTNLIISILLGLMLGYCVFGLLCFIFLA